MEREDFIQNGQLVVLKQMEHTVEKGWDSASSKAYVGKLAMTNGFHDTVLEAIQIKWATPNLDSKPQSMSTYVHYKDLRFPIDTDIPTIKKVVYFELKNLIV